MLGLSLSGMTNTITTGLPTCRHRQEAVAEAGEEVILTLPIITPMKTITITMDTITTTTGVATMTRTTAMRTSRGPGEDEERGEESVAVPVRPEAVVQSHRGAGWASRSEEALEQAEVKEIFHNVILIVSKWIKSNKSHSGD